MMQFLRYVISGGVATIVHIAVLVFLVEITDLNETLSSAVGFLIAVGVNYTIQYSWVFRSDSPHLAQGARFILVTTITLLVNVALFWILYRQLGVWYPVSQLFAIGVVFLLNYFLNKRYTFRVDVG